MNLLILDITGTKITSHLKSWYPKLHTVINNECKDSLKKMSCFENFNDLAFKVDIRARTSSLVEIVGG